jgi:ketol-acid reductoisomerase
MRKKSLIVTAVLIFTLSFISLVKTGVMAKPRGDHHPVAKAILEEGERQFIEYLKENNPEKFEEMKDLKTERPDLYSKIVRNGIREMRILRRLKKNDPAGYETRKKMLRLKDKNWRLGKEYRECKSAGRKEEIKKEIRECLDKLFDLKQEENESKIADVEKKLKKLRKRGETRKRNKKKIINQRFNQMVGDAEDLGWD